MLWPGTSWDLPTWLHPCHVPAEATFLSYFVHGENEAHSGRCPRAGSWGGKEVKAQRPGGPLSCPARSRPARPPLCRAGARRPPGRAGGGSGCPVLFREQLLLGPFLLPHMAPGGGSPWLPPRLWPGSPHFLFLTLPVTSLGAPPCSQPGGRERGAMGLGHSEPGFHSSESYGLTSSFYKRPEAASENRLLVT